MRLRLSRPYHQRPRSRARDTGQTNSNNKRHRGGNAFQKLIGRCRLPCVRCGGGDTASLVSDLQYHSLLATPVYLPRRLGGGGRGETSDGSEVEEEGLGDGKVEDEEEEHDTDLSMFSQGWDDTRDLYRTCNRNFQDTQEAGDVGPIAVSTRSHGSVCDHPLGDPRYTRPRPNRLTQRINTNFIPLAFNSHRSWLDRIHLGDSFSSSDELSHLLEAQEDDLAEGDQAATSSSEDSEGGHPNGVSGPNSSLHPNLTEVDQTTGVGVELNGLNSDTITAHTLHLDYDTLNPSQNTLWRGQGSRHTGCSIGDQLDTLSTDSSRSSLPLDFLNDLDIFEEDAQTVPATVANDSMAPQTGSDGHSEAILHRTCSNVVGSPSQAIPTEQTSSEEEDTMPESLRFLFQPLLAPSHAPATAAASEPGNTQTASTSVSQTSLAGYGNQPGSSGGNSRSSSLVNLQQNWYIYDPRLHPLHRRQERLQVEMRWRGVQTALSMPAMIGPPDYDDLSSHRGDNNHVIAPDSPPPYADHHDDYHQVDTAPPPTYAEAVLESLFTNTERGGQQGYPGESRDRNAFHANPLPTNCRATYGLHEDHVNTIDSNPGYNDADDLDTNVILSMTRDENTNELPASVHSSPMDVNDNQRRWQSGGRSVADSPAQALQAGFLCSRGRPAVAWNRQRWGETGNQSNFGINCRLQGVDGSRF